MANITITRTRAQLRQGIGKKISRRYHSSTSTGVASGSLTDTAAVTTRFPNDWFNNCFLVDSAGAIFFVTDFVQSTGVFSVRPTATPATGAFEVHSVDPVLMHEEMNHARTTLTQIGRRIVDDSLVTGSPIYNAGFEEWATGTTLAGWTVSTGALARERRSDKVLFGESSVKLPASSTLSLDVQYYIDLYDLIGETVTVYAWAWTDTATRARAGLEESASLTTYSDYHAAGSKWLLLSKEITLASGSAYVRPIVGNNGAGANTYFDSIWVEGPTSPNVLLVPGTMRGFPDQIEIATTPARSDTAMLSRHEILPDIQFREHWDENKATFRREMLLPSGLPSGYRLRLIGTGPLTSLDADTDRIELSEEEAELFETEASILVLERLYDRTPGMYHRDIDMRLARLNVRKQDLLKTHAFARRSVALPPDTGTFSHVWKWW